MCSFARSATAETLDFGGLNEKYKGSGDKTPPQCQVGYPSTSTEPFFIKWNCVDDIADPLDIKTELWIYVHGEPVGRLLASFLGFPASVKIDEQVVRSTTFAAGLPFSFRLIATDRAGNSTITQLLTVRAQDNGISSCDLTVVAAASESTGGATGLPEQRVVLSDSSVLVSQPSSTAFQVSTKQAEFARTCQIDTLCAEDSKLTYAADLSLSGTGGNTASGNIAISPGGLTVKLEGTASSSDLQLNSLQLTGSTTFEGRETNVTLNCARN